MTIFFEKSRPVVQKTQVIKFGGFFSFWSHLSFWFFWSQVKKNTLTKPDERNNTTENIGGVDAQPPKRFLSQSE